MGGMCAQTIGFNLQNEIHFPKSKKGKIRPCEQNSISKVLAPGKKNQRDHKKSWHLASENCRAIRKAPLPSYGRRRPKFQPNYGPKCQIHRKTCEKNVYQGQHESKRLQV